MKNIFVWCIALMTCIVMASCEQPVAVESSGDPELASLEFQIDVPVEEKLLQIWAPGKVHSFVYKATPSFSHDEDMEDEIVGECLDWTPVKFFDKYGDEALVGHLKASMGYYQPGGWTIEIQALNAGGNPVYYGTTGEIFLNKGEKNGFSIELHGVTTIGTDASLDIKFTAMKNTAEVETSPVPVARLTWLDGSKEMEFRTGWTSKAVGTDGRIEHAFHKDGLPAGETDLTIWLEMPDGSLITEEGLAALLINGETTKITGTLETGEYEDPSFDITEDKTEIKMWIDAVSGIRREEVGAAGTGSRMLFMKKSTTAKLSCGIDGKQADSYSWRLDGTEIGTGRDCSMTPTLAGQYTVTASVWRDEKTASTEVLVIVEE